MKRDEKFWDETLGGLDEKYINETAEKLAENDSFSAEQQTPELLKIPETKKSRWGVVLGVCAGVAAVVCLCLTGVVLANMRSIEIKVTGTPVTTLPPVVSETEDTAEQIGTAEPVVTAPPEKHKLDGSEETFSAAFTDIITDRKSYLKLYENVFYGEWTEQNTGGKLILSYNRDFYSPGDLFGGFVDTGSGAFILNETEKGREYYYVSYYEPNVLYYYDDNSGEIAFGSYEKAYIRTDPMEYQREAVPGKVSYLGVNKLSEEIKDGNSGLELTMSQALIFEDGNYCCIYGEDYNFELISREENSLSYRCNYRREDGGKTLSVTVNMVNDEGLWYVGSFSAGDEALFFPITDDDKSKLPEELFTGAPTMDFSIMDNYFYGRWIGIGDAGEECELFITNGKDCFAEPEGYGVVFTGFYSDEQGWYMTGMFGGTLTCYYIPTDEPDRMYCYYNLDEPCQRKNFEMYYDRVAPAADYNSDMTTYHGALSSLGLLRLKQLTGFELTEEMTTITVDGISWIRDTDRYSSVSKLYCTYIKDKLSITMRYVRYSEEYEVHQAPELQYITLHFEQKNGKWEMTSAERYKSGIEELKTPAYLEAQKQVDATNAEILKENPEASSLCKLSSEVRYFTTDEGYYYAVRRFGPDMAPDLEYGEIYYFNGLDYMVIDENGYLTDDYVMEDYSVGWIKGAECIEGYLYAGVQSDGRENIYRYDSSGKREVFLAGFSGLRLLGENYLLLSNGGVSRLYDIASGYYHLPADITKFVFDEDGGGFTATMSPDIDLHIRYNINEMTIEEQVKLLNLKADHIWTYTQLQSPTVDDGEGKAAVLHDSDKRRYVYPVIQEEFKNYDNVYNLISSVYTESCTNEILSQELPTYMRFMTLGKTYCSGGGPGTLVGVARIECKVKSVSGDTAELEYTAYYPNFDGLPQEEVDVHEVYTIEAVNTEKGWRLFRYYSPFTPGTQ